MEQKKAIEISNITKVYKLYNKPSDRLKETFSIRKKILHRDFLALKNVSFDVYEGEII